MWSKRGPRTNSDMLRGGLHGGLKTQGLKVTTQDGPNGKLSN